MFKRLFPYLGKYKKYLIVCFSVVLAEVIGEMMIPLLMAKIVDFGIPHQDIPFITTMGGVMAIIAATSIILGVINMWFSAKVSQGFAANIRKELFLKIQTFSFVTIDLFSTASLITRLTNDVTQLQNTVLMMLRILLRAPLMLICSMIFAVAINPRLSIIIFISVPLLVGCILIIIRTAERLFVQMQQRLDNLNNTLQENLIGIRVVKAFVREEFETEKFDEVNQNLKQATTAAGNLVSIIMPLMFLVLNGATVAVIWMGGKMVGQQLIGTGSLISFISYLMQILMSVMFFSMIFILLARAEASARRILEVLNTTTDITDPLTPTTTKITQGRIEFRNVDFRYQSGKKDKNILSSLSFVIEPGEMVGLVGGTGAGKTTLVNLIPRLFDVSNGVVLIDGVDVRQYPLATLRQSIGMVLQKNVLFSGTIRENLRWGKETATHAEIINACKIACAHDFISSLPQQYETILGQGGVNVSGGQKQRLCIARSLIKQPAILILDDSTSAVDTMTEAYIQQALKKQRRDCTILLIAQRISSVRGADKIIVLDDGQVSGIGTHQSLLKTNKVYQEICSSQQEGLGN